MTRLLLLLLMVTTSAAAQSSKKDCPPLPTDSAWLASPVYERCQVDREARLRGGLPKVQWSPTTADLEAGNCIRVEFQFIVDTYGRPEEGSIVTIVSTNENFEYAARMGIRRLRYEPAKKDSVLVRQVVSYTQRAPLNRVMVRVTGPAGSSPPMGGLPMPVSRPLC